ncbi:MAG: aldehyde dehydrogenase PuuC, partial [Burkholderiales bacterium]
MTDSTLSPPDWHAQALALDFDGRLFIDGQRIPAADGQTFACHSPIDGRRLCEVARGQQADIDRA